MVYLARKLLQNSLMPWLMGVVVAALVIGCGGGTDTASNGVGVGGTGAAAGPVTGYGSLIVNDIHFDFGNAQFTTEDADDSERDDESLPSVSLTRPVGFGTMVQITSGDVVRQANGYDRADASLITLISAIKGPITAITTADSTTATLTVMGQTVKVDASTQYATGHNLSRLTVGNKVVVYGNLDSSTGEYKATRVEYRSQMPTYKVRGYVTAVTSSTISLNNSLTLNLPLNARTHAWTVGQLVRVRTLATSGLTLPTNAIVAVPVGAKLSDGVRAHQDGLLSVSDGNIFMLDGVPVDFSQASGVPAQLRSGKRLSVTGVMRNGVLVASSVTSEDTEPNFTSKVKVRGQISGLVTQNDGSGQFQLLDGTVTYTSSTEINAQLANGAWVEAEGTTSADDETVTLATKISPSSPPSH